MPRPLIDALTRTPSPEEEAAEGEAEAEETAPASGPEATIAAIRAQLDKLEAELAE
jgi:hypothetical protein